MNYLSLFSGVGGIDLGLDRAGWTCAGQVELDPYCTKVLKRHWPGVPRHDDVRTAPQWWLDRGAPPVGLVAGGPPCQPFSRAGNLNGIGDPRWGWPWMRDVIDTVRPRYVLVENVAFLLRDNHAMAVILGDLAELGFDAEWEVVSACALGAPHTRERMFLVAYPAGADVPGEGPFSSATRRLRPELGGSGGPSRGGGSGWLPEPAVDRVAHGIPIRMVRDPLHGLGNAVVPQVAEFLGKLVLNHAERNGVML